MVQRIDKHYKQVFPAKITQFYQPARFNSGYEEDIFQFLLQLVTAMLDNIKATQALLIDQGFKVTTVVVCLLDNVSLMNQVDWQFFKEVHRIIEEHNSNNIVLLMNMRKENGKHSRLGLQVHESANEFYTAEIRPVEHEIFTSVVDLDPLDINSLCETLANLATPYAKETLEEIERMIKSEDPEVDGEDGKNSFIKQIMD